MEPAMPGGPQGTSCGFAREYPQNIRILIGYNVPLWAKLKLLDSMNNCVQNVLSKYLKLKVGFSGVISSPNCFGITE